MDLDMHPKLGSGYKSPVQIVRVVTEDWAARNLYCPCCDSDTLGRSPTNTRAIDFFCPKCTQVFQLKSGRLWSQTKVVDAAYSSMISAIRSDNVPNLFLLQYTDDWIVRNLLLVPYFFFTESVIERRKPLGPHARRAGWIGCNILLSEIPPDGKLQLVTEGVSENPSELRKRFDQVRPLSSLGSEMRGWTLEVLKAVRQFNRPEFTLNDIYAFEPRFSQVHPKNRNVRPKIRQQLQKLRDLDFLEFVSPGRYRVLKTG